MISIANRWCNTKGNPNIDPLLSPSSRLVKLDECRTPFVATFRDLVRLPDVSALFATNVVVREFLIDAARFQDQRGPAAFDLRDSRTASPLPGRVKLTFLLRIRKVVDSFSLFYILPLPSSERWKFEYIVVAGVVDTNLLTARQLMQVEVAKATSPASTREVDESL